MAWQITAGQGTYTVRQSCWPKHLPIRLLAGLWSSAPLTSTLSAVTEGNLGLQKASAMVLNAARGAQVCAAIKRAAVSGSMTSTSSFIG
jgi:hypothetical protein